MSTTQGISQMRAASIPRVSSNAQAPASPKQKLGTLFQQIDTAGKGSITKEQFQQAFSKLNLPESVKALGADAAFSKLDASHSGTISKQDFVNGLESLMGKAGVAQTKQASTEVKAAGATSKGDPTSPAAPSLAQPTSAPATHSGSSLGKTIDITA